MSKRGSFRDVKTFVLNEIRQGRWRPGDLIPKEQELATRFDCARMTAHRALRELAEEGVVERRRRSGTRVALQSQRTTLIDIPRVEDDITASGAAYRYERLSRRVAAPDQLARAQLQLDDSTQALRLECLHFANDVPFQFEERWVNLAAVPEAHEESFKDVSPNAWLLEQRPWSNVEHTISAVTASARVAQRLDLKPTDALLVLERRTWFEDDVITFARMSYPGRFYRIRTSDRLQG